MASLILHNVPESLIEALKHRAQLKQSSMEQEALEALGESLQPSSTSLGQALRDFIAQPHEHEEPYQDPFENVRDASSGREDNPWGN